MKKLSVLILIIVIFNFFLPFGFVLRDNLIQKNIALGNNACTILGAMWEPSGDQEAGFYKADSTNGKIILKTADCVDSILKLSIAESDGATVVTDDYWNDSGLYNKEIEVPSNNFSINLLLGEEDCEQDVGSSDDCDLYFVLTTPNNTENSSYPNSMLYYDCDGDCYDDGAFLGTTELADGPIEITGLNTSVYDPTYNLLVPIGDFTKAPDDIGEYFNIIFKIAIGLCGALAVIMIIIGGIQYMGDESIFGKTEAKSKITAAIFGLLIALGAYALLNTINPALLGGEINIKQVSAEIGGDTDTPTVLNRNILPTGIICSGDKSNIPNIAKSFSGKMTYEMGAKGVAGPNNTIKLDCSGFVNYVLDCASSNFVSGGTATIFNGAEAVTSTSIQGTKINGVELKVGDLVGWRSGENSENFGHVMIYIGEGQVQVADSHSTKTVGGALGVFSITKYKDRIKYIKRIP